MLGVADGEEGESERGRGSEMKERKGGRGEEED